MRLALKIIEGTEWMGVLYPSPESPRLKKFYLEYDRRLESKKRMWKMLSKTEYPNDHTIDTRIKIANTLDLIKETEMQNKNHLLRQLADLYEELYQLEIQ